MLVIIRQGPNEFPGKRRKEDMMEVMTDKQYDGILQMIGMILDGCKDLEDAKKKIDELREGKNEKQEQ